jgi:hypothetical protein
MTFINISDNIIPSEIKVTSINPYVYTNCNMFNTTQKKNKTRKRNNKQSLK